MTKDLAQIVEKIGYCSLVCPLCYEQETCSDCKTDSLNEARVQCIVRQCAGKKGINGCWECDDGPCEKGVFSGPQSIRLKAFTRFMKAARPELFVEYVLKNCERGIVFGPQNPYDACTSEAEVIRLLTQGARE